jgi:hypothetical protein
MSAPWWNGITATAVGAAAAVDLDLHAQSPQARLTAPRD